MRTKTSRPLAGLSLDLDNQWTYMKIHGDSGWEEFPSYLDRFIPEVLEILERLKLKITFFIVGQDAVLEKNRRALAEIPKNGHDVGNHSFHHEPWFQIRSPEKIREEILEAEQAIQGATGRKPQGFRSPGFSWSADLIQVLAESSYIYDASTLPSSIGPLGRLYYFRKSSLTTREKEIRKDLFGGIRDSFRPVRPYMWRLPSRKRLLEIPVTTVPLGKIPFHLSYLIYIGRVSFLAMRNYLKTAVRLCRLFHTGLSFLLHPLDFLGGDEFPELAFFPGMDLNKKQKLKFFQKVIEIISADFELVDMSSYAKAVLSDGRNLSLHEIAQEPSFQNSR